MGKFTTLLRATGLVVTVAMPATAQDANTVLATVNGKEITLGHVIALQDRLPDQYKSIDDQRLYDGILDQLIQQTALADEMRKNMSLKSVLGLQNEESAFLSGEYLSAIGSAEIDEEAVKAAYAEQYADVAPEQEFNAAHILVEDEELAKDLSAKASAGADFEELAKQHSTGPSGPRGGNLGWFGKGQMVPAFEEAVIALENGGVSEPVQTQFGWHVVKRLDSRNVSAPDFEDVRQDIISELQSQAITDAVTKVTEGAEVTLAEVEIDPAMIRKVELLSE
ncbi:MAG: peptidylprolyl isomerase [Pseudomonadota bacterium]